MVQIELDCKLVVDGIMNKSNDQSNFGNIMSNCRPLLQQFPNFKIRFIRILANYVAHTLHIVSKSYASHNVFDLISSCTTPIILNENNISYLL